MALNPGITLTSGDLQGASEPFAHRLRRVLVSRQTGMSAIALGIFVWLSINAPHFLHLSNLTGIGLEMAFVAIPAVGMTYLFISGEFDLSAGSVLSMAGVLFGLLIVNEHMNPWTAAVVVLGFGAVVGIINGGVTVWFRVPSMITTLGMLSLLGGTALVVTGEFPVNLTNVPHSSLFSVVSGQIGSGPSGVPVEILWMAGVVLVGIFILRKTRFGYNVFSSGGNARAARAMGVNTGRVKIVCFVMVGVLTSFVAISQTAWVQSASPVAGASTYLFQVMGAVILGGIAPTGGEGSVYGTVVGAFILAALADGFVLLGVSGDYNTVFAGAVIIIAGILDVATRNYVAKRGNQTWLKRNRLATVVSKWRAVRGTEMDFIPTDEDVPVAGEDVSPTPA
jgi:ribose transport system permease protein